MEFRVCVAVMFKKGGGRGMIKEERGNTEQEGLYMRDDLRDPVAVVDITEREAQVERPVERVRRG